MPVREPIYSMADLESLKAKVEKDLNQFKLNDVSLVKSSFLTKPKTGQQQPRKKKRKRTVQEIRQSYHGKYVAPHAEKNKKKSPVKAVKSFISP